MNIVLVDRQKAIVDAWKAALGQTANVTIHYGSIFNVACDALVSPANSFGFMDGGLDLAISEHFGWLVQKRLQQAIRAKHHGELLVGAAEIVPTEDTAIPFVISAPTMRVPMILGAESANVYLAARAVLLLVQHGQLPNGQPVAEHVKTVAIPGMGTGVGQVPPEVCARQMRQAIDDTRGEPRFPSSWREAQLRHQLLYSDRYRDLQL